LQDEGPCKSKNMKISECYVTSRLESGMWVRRRRCLFNSVHSNRASKLRARLQTCFSSSLSPSKPSEKRCPISCDSTGDEQRTDLSHVFRGAMIRFENSKVHDGKTKKKIRDLDRGIYKCLGNEFFRFFIL